MKISDINKSNNIVFFGGAGVSTESNIPDFRSANGIFSIKLNRSFTPEQLVSRTMFERYPEDFFDFYKKNLIYPDAKPNAAHYYLAKLEKSKKSSGYLSNIVLDTNCSGVKLLFSFILNTPLALLKSGILDSVETPAPPKNTILLLLFISLIFIINLLLNLENNK